MTWEVVSPNGENPLGSERGSQTPKIGVIKSFIDEGCGGQCEVKGYMGIA